MPKKILSLIFILSSSLSLAKGPMLQGTYQATDPHDPNNTLEVKFVAVNIPGTTTRVAQCNFDYACQESTVRQMPCPDDETKRCDYLNDVVFTRLDYDHKKQPFEWEIDYAFVPESGFVTPFFTLKTDSLGEEKIVISFESTGDVTFNKVKK